VKSGIRGSRKENPDVLKSRQQTSKNWPAVGMRWPRRDALDGCEGSAAPSALPVRAFGGGAGQLVQHLVEAAVEIRSDPWHQELFSARN